MQCPISQIIVEDRFRLDAGDLDDLAESIRKYGLIHPILIDDSFHLIAGGRRLEAIKRLGWPTIEVQQRADLTEADRREIELEENIKRKEMTWQERCFAFAEIHKLRSTAAALQSKRWGLRETASVLGVSFGHLADLLALIECIKAEPDGPVARASGIYEALRARLQQREDAALALLSKAQPLSVEPRPISEVIQEPTDVDEDGHLPKLVFRLDDFCRLGDALALLPTLPDESVDHIVTDPPYGVDVARINEQTRGIQNIDRVLDTHDVEDNQKLFSAMMPQFYRVMKPGFCAIWCDIMQWQRLYDLAVAVGFKVQRWPLVWYKTHSCLNSSAFANFTKDTELVMLMRKGSATLVSQQPTSVVSASGTEDRKTYAHPFVKPTVAWNFILDAVSLRGQLILDPFAGVGSCGIAAIGGLRRWLGFEIEPAHYNNMRENLCQHFVERVPNCEVV